MMVAGRHPPVRGHNICVVSKSGTEQGLRENSRGGANLRVETLTNPYGHWTRSPALRQPSQPRRETARTMNRALRLRKKAYTKDPQCALSLDAVWDFPNSSIVGSTMPAS